LDLKNWFNHIIYNNIDTSTRQLDFYPDFLGKDTYIYFLQFDRKIKLLSSYKDADIKNDFGELKIKIEQLSADAIMITSYFSTPNKMVSADKIKAVKEIFDKIKDLNNSCLKIKIG
ncbi:MAG: hypothetical protein Q8880_12420, partial [Bacteroidota bacterium]|nr:hypothetical protein [Bacteroidota bacterium]